MDPSNPIVLRPMTFDDLDEIVVIEKQLFSEPWPRTVFVREVEDTETSWSVVGCRDGHVVCYAIAWVVRQEFHIANLAVREDAQGKGLGAYLLDQTLEEGRIRGCRYVALEVRQSNLPAIGLYDSRDFRGVAIRKGYYGANGEDAIVMVRELSGPTGDTSGLV